MQQNNGECSGCGQTQVLFKKENPKEDKAPCGGCGGNKFQGKLGTCKECIISNIIGTVLGWLTFGFFFFFYPIKNAMLPSLVFATFFTLLLSAHGIAYLFKKKKK